VVRARYRQHGQTGQTTWGPTWVSGGRHCQQHMLLSGVLVAWLAGWRRCIKPSYRGIPACLAQVGRPRSRETQEFRYNTSTMMVLVALARCNRSSRQLGCSIVRPRNTVKRTHSRAARDGLAGVCTGELGRWGCVVSWLAVLGKNCWEVLQHRGNILRASWHAENSGECQQVKNIRSITILPVTAYQAGVGFFGGLENPATDGRKEASLFCCVLCPQLLLLLFQPADE